MDELKNQLDHKNAQLAAVRDISRAIAEAQDLDETLDLITRRTTEVMHVDSCSIYLYHPSGACEILIDDLEPNGDQLILVASTGLNKSRIGQLYLPRGAGLTGWAADHRQVVAVSDASADKRFYRVIGSGESRFCSLMAVPLVSHSKVIGAANVQTIKRHEFTADEIELFGFISELAATAIEKMQLVHTAIVQEMHHRVKNNLQTIAMLLRLQMAQDKKLSPHAILNETINRVLSIATVHEILSESGVDKLGVLDLIKRLVVTISSNMVNPATKINISVSGDNIELPAQKATSLALVTNELLQNALEHGMAGRAEGNITITHQHDHEWIKLTVCDDGNGLPPGFNPETDLNLGLDIVQASITEDMRGTFEIGTAESSHGTQVKITLPIR